MGDIVTVIDERIGLSVKARVISINYNPIKNRFTKIELGNFKNEYRTSKKLEKQILNQQIRKLI